MSLFPLICAFQDTVDDLLQIDSFLTTKTKKTRKTKKKQKMLCSSLIADLLQIQRGSSPFPQSKKNAHHIAALLALLVLLALVLARVLSRRRV
jgi:hypothetical protein